MTALIMTKLDVRAALYAPLRVLVYENEENQSFAEYDLPSTLFGQFGNSDVAEVGKELDKKLLLAITLADQIN